MKILFLVTEDWYFWSHRLALARKVRRMGAEVLVMTHVDKLGEAMNWKGFEIIPWHISRGSLNPIRELSAFLQVLRAYRRTRPDLVHHVALKPVVYGGLAARLCGGLLTINTTTGLGEVFTSRSPAMALLRSFLLLALRFALGGRNSRTIVQNAENRDLLIGARVIPPDRIFLIRGSGVDPGEFVPHPEPSGVPVVAVISRMLWGKGIGEFVAAAEMVRKQGIQGQFVLVGDLDPHNPGAIPVAQLRSWEQAGVVEWWGHRNDMVNLLSQVNLVCLPSHYGEGVPKVLIEASACARAIVTTDAPGCRDIVRHGENGFLVPVRDAGALARSIADLLGNPALRAQMGIRGRAIVMREFSEEQVLRETFGVYARLLGSRWPLPAPPGVV